MKTATSDQPKVATPEKWLASRLELLREEKELTHLSDRIAQHRRELPWMKMTKPYTFDSPAAAYRWPTCSWAAAS